MHTLGSGDIFSSVGIWVFGVKTRIYCQGVKNLNRILKKVVGMEGEALFLRKIGSVGISQVG